VLQDTKHEIATMNSELREVVKTNTAALEQINALVRLKMVEIEGKLEYVMESSRQITSIEVRTAEMVRNIRKINHLESRLDEAVKNSRRIPHFETILNRISDD